jgi:hypothetical protein
MQNLPDITVPYEHLVQVLEVELKDSQFWSIRLQLKAGEVPAGLAERM